VLVPQKVPAKRRELHGDRRRIRPPAVRLRISRFWDLCRLRRRVGVILPRKLIRISCGNHVSRAVFGTIGA
jgi:hypothetical protein